MSNFSRRQTLGLLTGASFMAAPQLSFGQGIEGRKFIFVILRGAMDGLAALIPDDKEIEAIRGSILPAHDERLNLGNGFRLHPSFKSLKDIYAQGDAAFIHASATDFRQRSHFEGQDVLEILGIGGAKDGWMNRLLAANGQKGLAVGRAVPLAMKGPAPVTNWSPPLFEAAPDDLLIRLSDLYANDPLLSASLSAAQDTSVMPMELSRRDARKFTKKYTLTLSPSPSIHPFSVLFSFSFCFFF